ncbi:hypothetical protein BOTBODRAFT_445216 [Botryobasidium botryosum FD-172 SS1]|uniref:Uncharacterized protein n=1 Tax=Botryobasidium botryosum (strain FD-172 SS1) TaxID=930990 RepID=A0A067MVM7_BOTB1|nr:hypothetical protein BOTBODRAFT_445216 [Botryobasidium botryosum FD-172 SS1]
MSSKTYGRCNYDSVTLVLSHHRRTICTGDLHLHRPAARPPLTPAAYHSDFLQLGFAAPVSERTQRLRYPTPRKVGHTGRDIYTFWHNCDENARVEALRTSPPPFFVENVDHQLRGLGQPP